MDNGAVYYDQKKYSMSKPWGTSIFKKRVEKEWEKTSKWNRREPIGSNILNQEIWGLQKKISSQRCQIKPVNLNRKILKSHWILQYVDH